MEISNLIHVDRVICHSEATSKKRALEIISECLANSLGNISTTQVFEYLLERERLGSTGLGGGVAIPHCRIPNIDKAMIAFATLEDKIDYDAIDNKPIDIILALIVPENCTEAHLKILALAAEMFSDSGFCDLLRSCASQQRLYELLSNWTPKSLSA